MIEVTAFREDCSIVAMVRFDDASRAGNYALAVKHASEVTEVWIDDVEKNSRQMSRYSKEHGRWTGWRTEAIHVA